MNLFYSASFWAIIGTGLRVGSGLIVLPIALRSLQQNELGLYYTFLGITGLAIMLDFGFSPTIVRNASYAMGGAERFSKRGLPAMSGSGNANWLLLHQLETAAKRWYHMLGYVICSILVFGGGLFVRGQIIQADLPRELIFCWMIFAVAATYGFATSYWKDLLAGIGQMTAVAQCGIVSQIFGLILLVVGLLSGWGIWSYAISSTFTAVACHLLYKRAFYRSIPARDGIDGSVHFSEVFGSLWPMAWRQGVVTLGAYLIIRGNTLVCSQKLGLSETGSYGLTLNVLTLIFQVVSVPLMMSWPQIGKLRVRRENGLILKVFFMRAYGGLVAAALIIVVLVMWGNDLLAVIKANSSLLPTLPFTLFACVLWLENHHSMYAGLVLSENENPFLKPAIISGLLIFGLSWWSASAYGVVGLIATQGLVQLLWNNWWPIVRALRSLR